MIGSEIKHLKADHVSMTLIPVGLPSGYSTASGMWGYCPTVRVYTTEAAWYTAAWNTSVACERVVKR